MMQPSAFKLSFCIGTYNRADLIGATLESIVAQATTDCEIVVSDNASTDNTEQVVSEYAHRFDRLRYIRQDTNTGLDRNFDCAVELARGEYCWLMPDDDLLKPGAVAAVLEALRRDMSLIIVNIEYVDFDMTRVLQHRYLDFESDRVYGPGEMDRLFLDVNHTKYIGAYVIKRGLWLERDRERYYGSLFIHVGVIFQESLPGDALVIAEPYISYRMGNTHTFSARMFETLLVKWPSVVWSLALSRSTKESKLKYDSWRSPQRLLWFRAWGYYSMSEYRRWIRPQLRSVRERLMPILLALLPGVLLNAAFVFYYSVTRRRRGALGPDLTLQFLRESRFHFGNWKLLKRRSRLDLAEPELVAANNQK